MYLFYAWLIKNQLFTLEQTWQVALCVYAWNILLAYLGVLKRAGLPKVRFHDLRHTFATLALQNGVDIKTVSGMLGHFSAGFTLDTYAHVTTSAKREAAKTMGSILSGAV